MKNKPLIDALWDESPTKAILGIPADFAHTAPRGKTQIFVLSPEVALAAENLVRSDTFTFPASQDMRMPYEHTAVEYAISSEISAARATGVNPPDGQRLARIGAHIADLGGAFLCTPYWVLDNGYKMASVFSFSFGARAPGAPIVELNTKVSGDGASVDVGLVPSASTVRALEAAGVPLDTFMQQTHVHPMLRTMIQEAAIEVPVLMFAATMLLSCKSGVLRSRVDARTPSTPGLGAKRRKAQSASAFTVIHLSALETVNDVGDVESKLETAAHYVRGHFKQRKTGVYWWNAFVRGTGEPRKRTAYNVRG